MPRQTLGTRLQSIVDNPYLPASRKDFAKNLLDFYNRKGMLTRGRRVWVDRLEDEISTREEAEKNDKPEVVSRIDELLSRILAENSWNARFLKSLREQAIMGYELSTKQLSKLEDIAEEYTSEAIAARDEWPNVYREKFLKDAVLIAAYYDTTLYYREFVNRVNAAAMAGDVGSYVPPMRFFMKLRNNKYVTKVLKAWYDDAKYPIGSAVMSRANAPYRMRHALTKGGVVIATDLPIISAASGAKRYSVLPYGASAPIKVEERHLKKIK